MTREQIKEKLLSMYENNKSYMKLKEGAEVTKNQFNNYISFLSFLFGDLYHVKGIGTKELNKLIKSKFERLEDTINDIYIRGQQEQIKQSSQYKELEKESRKYYKLYQLINIKHSQILHGKVKVKNKNEVLNLLKIAYEKAIKQDQEYQNKLKELLKVE